MFDIAKISAITTVYFELKETLNKRALEIWRLLDGNQEVKEFLDFTLIPEYSSPVGIEADKIMFAYECPVYAEYPWNTFVFPFEWLNMKDEEIKAAYASNGKLVRFK